MSKLERLKEQYKVILNLLIKYGDTSMNPQINQVKSILRLLDDTSPEVSEELIVKKARKMNDSSPRGKVDPIVKTQILII